MQRLLGNDLEIKNFTFADKFKLASSLSQEENRLLLSSYLLKKTDYLKVIPITFGNLVIKHLAKIATQQPNPQN